jgi:glucose/arabinose dehydrogenase
MKTLTATLLPIPNMKTRFATLIAALTVAAAAQGDTPSLWTTETFPDGHIEVAVAAQGDTPSPQIRISTRFITAQHVAVAAQGDTPSPTQDIAIKNIDAATAFQSLRASFPDASGVVTAIKLDSNSLTVIADHPKAAELRKRLAEMDVRPKQIMIEAVITEVDADGSEKVICRPALCLVDGIPGEIALGENGKKHLKLKITPTSVPEVARK